METLLVVLLCVAVYRGTRLVTRDKFPLIALPREAFVQRWGAYEETSREKTAENWRAFRWLFGMEFPSIGGGRTNLVMKSAAYLWECDWCTSMWMGGLLTYLTAFYVDLPYPWLVWLVTSAVTGLVTQAEAVMDKRAE